MFTVHLHCEPWPGPGWCHSLSIVKLSFLVLDYWCHCTSSGSVEIVLYQGINKFVSNKAMKTSLSTKYWNNCIYNKWFNFKFNWVGHQGWHLALSLKYPISFLFHPVSAQCFHWISRDDLYLLSHQLLSSIFWSQSRWRQSEQKLQRVLVY